MLSFKTAACLALIALLVMAVECRKSRGGREKEDEKRPAHDLTNPEELKELLASKVVHAEVMERPLGRNDKVFGDVSHSGVRVTLEDGSKHLIHKAGKGWERMSSTTVVTDARNMSPKWQPMKKPQERNFEGRVDVSDLIRAGGTGYHVLFNNCHRARRRMMNQKVDGSRSG